MTKIGGFGPGPKGLQRNIQYGVLKITVEKFIARIKHNSDTLAKDLRMIKDGKIATREDGIDVLTALRAAITEKKIYGHTNDDIRTLAKDALAFIDQEIKELNSEIAKTIEIKPPPLDIEEELEFEEETVADFLKGYNPILLPTADGIPHTPHELETHHKRLFAFRKEHQAFITDNKAEIESRAKAGDAAARILLSHFNMDQLMNRFANETDLATGINLVSQLYSKELFAELMALDEIKIMAKTLFSTDVAMEFSGLAEILYFIKANEPFDWDNMTFSGLQAYFRNSILATNGKKFGLKFDETRLATLKKFAEYSDDTESSSTALEILAALSLYQMMEIYHPAANSTSEERLAIIKRHRDNRPGAFSLIDDAELNLNEQTAKHVDKVLADLAENAVSRETRGYAQRLIKEIEDFDMIPEILEDVTEVIEDAKKPLKDRIDELNTQLARARGDLTTAGLDKTLLARQIEKLAEEKTALEKELAELKAKPAGTDFQSADTLEALMALVQEGIGTLFQRVEQEADTLLTEITDCLKELPGLAQDRAEIKKTLKAAQKAKKDMDTAIQIAMGPQRLAGQKELAEYDQLLNANAQATKALKTKKMDEKDKEMLLGFLEKQRKELVGKKADFARSVADVPPEFSERQEIQQAEIEQEERKLDNKQEAIGQKTNVINETFTTLNSMSAHIADFAQSKFLDTGNLSKTVKNRIVSAEDAIPETLPKDITNQIQFRRGEA